jgi:hypothetical protein
MVLLLLSQNFREMKKETLLIILSAVILIAIAGLALSGNLLGRIIPKQPVSSTSEAPEGAYVTNIPTPQITSSPISQAKAPSASSGIYLMISSPQDNSVASSPVIVVKGATLAAADVFVNDGQAKADAKGNFSVSLTLDEGENNISVSVNDANGNYAVRELTVSYNP